MNIYRGDSAEIEVEITDSDGAAYNLTDHTIKFTAKCGTKTITKTTDSGITITDATGGKCLISLLATDTDVVGEYKYDVEISKDPKVYTVCYDRFSIINDITV